MPRVKARTRRPAPVSDSLAGLGERIRKARIELGLSQAALGAPHFTRAHISAIELGKVRPAMQSLEHIAAKLGKSASYFLEDEEEEKRRQQREMDITAASALVTRIGAAEAAKRLRQLLDGAASPQEICRLRLLLGTALNFLMKGAEALRELTVAERIATQLSNESLRRLVQYQTAIATRLTGSPQRARDLLGHLLEDVDRSKSRDQILRTKILKDLGAVAYDMGEHEAASGYYLSALEWANDLGDVASLVTIYGGLASSYRAMGDLEAATSYLQRALSASEIANDLTTIALISNQLAVIAAEKGHLKAAYQHVDRAIEIARASGPASYLPHYFVTKAECAIRGGDWESAREIADEALRLANDSSNARAAAAARVALSEVNLHFGASGEGERQLREAAATYESLGASTERAEVLMRLSRVARERGDAALAESYATQAYKTIKPRSGLVER